MAGSIYDPPYRPTRKIRWRRVTCPSCGNLITGNALGRAAHIRHCKGKAEWIPKPTPKEQPQ